MGKLLFYQRQAHFPEMIPFILPMGKPRQKPKTDLLKIGNESLTLGPGTTLSISASCQPSCAVVGLSLPTAAGALGRM